MFLCAKCHSLVGCRQKHQQYELGSPCDICGESPDSGVNCDDSRVEELGRLSRCVQRFGQIMLAQLVRNVAKGGWDGCDPHWLFKRALEECGELSQALATRDLGSSSVATEAADAANFLMMIALKALDASTRKTVD